MDEKVRSENDSLRFVQFPHPGPEHQPNGTWMDWNRRAHARKFLKADGTYLVDGQPRNGPVSFWGEWEPQSRVIKKFPNFGPGFPHWLHEPYWAVPRHRRGLQNTDPLVFGRQFIYSNCRQRRNRRLRTLAAGSIVAFGSKFRGEFVLDTVFVVSAGAEAFHGSSANEVHSEDWVKATVFDPLSASQRGKPKWFRLYRGVSYSDATAGPFSFVPCLPNNESGSPFARPALRLDRERLSRNLAQGAKATPASHVELREIWGSIVDQVAEAGLTFGVQLAAPPSLPDSEVPDSNAIALPCERYLDRLLTILVGVAIMRSHSPYPHPQGDPGRDTHEQRTSGEASLTHRRSAAGLRFGDRRRDSAG